MIIAPIYLAFAGLTALAYGAKRYRDKKSTFHGELTPERQVVYETAMNQVAEAEKLRALADVYDKQGLHGHAEMLRKRANLRELPKDLKEARREVFRKAMASKNKEAVRQVAEAFLNEGATGAAEALYKYSEGL